MKRSWLLAGVVVLALAGTALVIAKSVADRPVVPAVQAADKPATTAVSALGRIRPLGEIIDVGADPTRRVAKLLVAEGQAVKRGDVLAYLDNYDELLASANYAESQYAGGKAQLEARTALEKANIRRSETDLKSVETINPKNITVQELTVDKLKAELSLAQIEADRYETLFKQRSASREDLDKKRTDLTAKKQAVESAQADLSKMKEALPLDVQKAKDTVASSKANLHYAAASVDVNSLEKNVALAKSRLATAVVHAPTDGRILKLRTRQGEVVRNQTVVTMGDTSTMSVVAEVYETDVLRLREGQRATITASALPAPLSGQVVYVGQVINKQSVFSLDPSAPSDARVAEVRIRLDDTETAARLLNLQVVATIEVGATTGAGTSPERRAP